MGHRGFLPQDAMGLADPAALAAAGVQRNHAVLICTKWRQVTAGM